jgi:hypothetical protein
MLIESDIRPESDSHRLEQHMNNGHTELSEVPPGRDDGPQRWIAFSIAASVAVGVATWRISGWDSGMNAATALLAVLLHANPQNSGPAR